MKIYNKAIRDKIPEIIKASGTTPTIEVLSDEEFLKKLEIKLDEELLEYKESKKVEELCDLIEIAYRIAELQGISNESLNKIREEKNVVRGKFVNNLFLVEVKDHKVINN